MAAFRSSSVESHGSASTMAAGFRAPAHKNSHHLHSIPPREKSTRTLIVDHMLWVHGRTRLAQARAELGMPDLTGGPSSVAYVHRTRPENYDDADADVPDDNDNDRRQDLPLARTLRLRAEGLEKVVTSMLTQPPPRPVHTLPNGVRLRLALGTIINDFFARQAPHPPYRHTKETPRSRSGSRSQSPSRDRDPVLPHVLVPLTTISGAFRVEPQSTPSYQIALSPFAAPHTYAMPPPPPKRKIKPMASRRTRALYAAGADPSTANSLPGFRCPRHLYIGCEICVEARTSAASGGRHFRTGSGSAVGMNSPDVAASPSTRSSPTAGWNANASANRSGHGTTLGGGGISGWKDGSGIGTGLLKPDVRGSALRRKVDIEHAHRGRLNIKGKEKEGYAAPSRTAVGTGAGNTKLGNLIPRFIKLSALVAGELGREIRGEEVDDGEGDTEEDSGSEDDHETPTQATPTRKSRAHRKMYDSALRPTGEWYSLLGGLLTRAVVEGYLTAGWGGVDATECLCLVGVGAGRETKRMFDFSREDGDEEDEVFEEVEPDEYPSLLEAVRVLFPSLRPGTKMSGAEEEYGDEMFERLRRFYDIPECTPDLSTHMEDMAWQYPAEPVELAAVRFCESIAEWRGKPELEMYKKKSPSHQQQFTVSPLADRNNHNHHPEHDYASNSNRHMYQQNPNRGMMPTKSWVHSNSVKGKQKSSIWIYFSPAPGAAPSAQQERHEYEYRGWAEGTDDTGQNVVSAPKRVRNEGDPEGHTQGVKRARM